MFRQRLSTKLLRAVDASWARIRAAIRVNPVEVVQDQTNRLFCVQYTKTNFNLFWVPHIILVTHKDHIALTQANRLLEILHIPEILRVAKKPDFERRRICKSLNNPQRSIRRIVVADDYLVWPVRLLNERGKLRIQKTFAVIRT